MASRPSARQPSSAQRLWRHLLRRGKLRLAPVLFRIARRFLPVLRLRNTVIVSRAADVRSVLSRDRDFSVRIFRDRMSETMGLTFLGMDPSPEYDHEANALRAAFQVPDPRPSATADAPGTEHPGRLAWARRYASELSRRRVEDALKTHGRVDVVRDLGDVVPLSFARDYFGTPEPDPQDPAILHWLKQISFYIFSPSPTAWAEPARRAGQEIRAHFRGLVAARKAAIAAGSETPDDVLGRLLAAQTRPGGLDDDAIARSLGFISGAMIPTSWLFIEAVDTLMRLPRADRERLHRHARADDALAVRAYVIEAARFFPFPYFIIRHAECDAEIGGRRIEAGSKINLAIGSATVDPLAVGHASRFRPGRPESEYMLFGHGTHLCYGKDLAEELMTQMAIALFSRENLRRAPGLQGRLLYGPKGVIPDGYYPESLILVADG